MFFGEKNPDSIVAMASILVLGGVIPLSSALVSQYGFGFHPCHFCLLQRYPYLVVIAAGVLTLLVPRGGLRFRLLVAIGVYALLITGGLGLIHTGIENKWLSYTGGCVAQAPAGATLEALRTAIANAPLVACDEATAVWLGLSMATWNALWALCVIVLIALQIRFERRRHDGHS